MNVGAEITNRCSSLDRGDHLASDHEAAQVLAASFFDELLHQQVGVETLHGIDHAFRRLLRLRQHNAPALSALQQFENQWCTADHLDQVLGVQR